jgi:serine/threonine-protein kinase
VSQSRVQQTLVLPADVKIVAVEELGGDVRRRLGSGTGDFAVTRARARGGSMLVGSDGARLLDRFREPTTIVDAVIALSTALEAPPQGVLEDAYELLRRALDARLLVPAGSANTNAVTPTCEVGGSIAGLCVAECIHLVEDVEVYRATAGGDNRAVKIARPDAPPGLAAALAHEALVLERLAGDPAPRLLEQGEHDGRPYLVLEWCEGATSWRWAARRGDLMDGVCAIAAAYAAVHHRGVAHGDVHPRNVLVDDRLSVRLIDFGFARVLDPIASFPDPGRAGVGFFFEPEYARARLRHKRPPGATFASDQYALAALVYLLLTGRHHLELSYERAASLEQIASDLPRPFLVVGLEPHPALERVLGRALSKRPEERYASCAEFATDLQAAANGAGPQRITAPPPRADVGGDELQQRFGLASTNLLEGLPSAPTASVNHGAAGIAYAFLRLAQLRDDPGLLALADAWATRAIAESSRPGAFCSPDLRLLEADVGPISLYHRASGVHCVRALVSHAMGDSATTMQAVRAFADAVAGRSWPGLDLTLGWGSVLLGCALLLEEVAPEPELLDAVANAALTRIWEAAEPVELYGIAHGWAGLLYSTLRWSTASGHPLPSLFPSRLAELAERGRDGAAWPRGPRDPVVWPGWCHGSAGHTLLWVLAHRSLGGDEHLALAEQAAMHTWRHPLEGSCTLCCGLAGQAYALLALHNATHDKTWLARASTLTKSARTVAASTRRTPDSLYRGEVGVALLEAEITCPEIARMPLFEPAP